MRGFSKWMQARYSSPAVFQFSSVELGRWRIRLMPYPAFAEEGRMLDWMDEGRRLPFTKSLGIIWLIRQVQRRREDGDKGELWVLHVKQLASPAGWLCPEFPSRVLLSPAAQ